MLSSRSDAKVIALYASQLTHTVQCDRTPVEAYPLADFQPPEVAASKLEDPKEPNPAPEQSPDPLPLQKPPVRTFIGRNADIEAMLFPLNSQKLTSLYSSCVSLSLRDHAPLITVGLWSILESLCALHAGKEVQFVNYLGGSNLEQKFGIKDTAQRKTMRAALDRISTAGNSTKHHPTAASFDGPQLANDFDILVPLVAAIYSSILK